MELNTRAYNDYIASTFAPQDPALTDAIAEMERENVPGINVSAVEGKLLQGLALSVGAKRILEVGTLGHRVRNTTATDSGLNLVGVGNLL